MNYYSDRFLRAVIQVVTPCVLLAGCLATPAFGQFAAEINKFTLTQQQFNIWLTGGGSNQSAKALLTTQLQLKIAEITPACDLSAEQKEQLTLAGQVDIERFTRRLDVLEKELVGKTYDANNLNEPYQQIQSFAQELQQGLLEENSLFQKVVNHTITDEQGQKIHKLREERWKYQYNAAVKVQVAVVQRLIAMTQTQREQLVELFPVPGSSKRTQDSSLQILVCYQLSQIPKEKLLEILDEPQVEAIEGFRRRYAAYRAHLRSLGFEVD